MNDNRGAQCDIRIQLGTISEEHCRIYRDDNGMVTLDADSEEFKPV